MNLAFKTRARTVELLGRSQVRDGVTAVNELVKNAHDADAATVEVHFGTGAAPNDAIVIADDGCGMSLEDLRTNWMVLGTTGKRDRQSTPTGRPLMGAKGVGRLAMDALGSQLLLITKADRCPWVVAYVNWDLFGNPNLLVDEVQVPCLELATPCDDVLRDAVTRLRRVQIQNLALDAWYDRPTQPPLLSEVDALLAGYPDEFRPAFGSGVSPPLFAVGQKHLFEATLNAIRNLAPNYGFLAQLLDETVVRPGGTGTLLYITTLRSDWDLTGPQNGATLRRLSRTLSWVVGGTSLDLACRLYCNGNDLAPRLDRDLTDEMFELYDIRFAGQITLDPDGVARFRGSLDVRGVTADLLAPVNDVLRSGLPVMDRLSGKAYEDCGSFGIEVCHVEGDQWRTNLTPNQYSEIMALIEDRDTGTGGIRVYRDGARILPYGEPGNDFLEIEARRTSHAGRWMFSHRNTFGRISLSRAQNARLEEKTSREGFIENAPYTYLRGTCISLLMAMASQFLNKESQYRLREVYARLREQDHDAQVAQQKKEKAERDRLRKAVSEQEACMDSFSPDAILDELGYAAALAAAEDVGSDAPVSHIRKHIRKLDEIRSGLLGVSAQKVNPPTPVLVSGGVRFRRKVEEHNRVVEEVIGTALPRIDRALASLRALEDAALSRRKADTRVLAEECAEIGGELDKVACAARESEGAISAQVGLFDKMAQASRERVQQILEGGAVRQELDALRRDLQQVRKALDRETDVDEIASRVAELRRRSEEFRGRLPAGLGDMRRQFDATLHSLPVDGPEDLSRSWFEANSAFVMAMAGRTDDLTELANIGLAAEVMTHEFGEYVHTIRTSIEQLRASAPVPSAAYWLKVLDAGVRAVSAHLAALQPINKSRHSYREPVDLRQTLEGICLLLGEALRRNRTQLRNRVPDGVTMRASLSRFFPAVCNILNNMQHWVLLSAGERVIEVEYAPGALRFTNSGPPIREETEPHLFTPFFSTREGGRGLGLYLSRMSLRAMDWDLVLERRDAPDWLGGPVFAILMPEADREQ